MKQSRPNSGRLSLAIWFLPATIAVALATPVGFLGNLPDQVASHWDLSWEPNYALPPAVAFGVPFLTWLAIWVGLIRSRSNTETATFAAIYAFGGLALAVQALILVANVGANSWQEAELPGVFLVLIPLATGSCGALGIWLGKRLGREDSESLPSNGRARRPDEPDLQELPSTARNSRTQRRSLGTATNTPFLIAAVAISVASVIIGGPSGLVLLGVALRYTHKLWMTGCWLGRDVPS